MITITRMDSVLLCPVEIQQADEEFQNLLLEFKGLSPKNRILEIGIYRGGTLWYWIKYSDPGTNILAIDNLIREDDIKIWGTWMSPDKKLSLVEGNSIELAPPKDSPPEFDFIFIDGNHDYDYVKHDFYTWLPCLRDGGILAMHDINNLGFGVKKLWGEIKDLGMVTKEFITMQDVGGIGVVYK